MAIHFRDDAFDVVDSADVTCVFTARDGFFLCWTALTGAERRWVFQGTDGTTHAGPIADRCMRLDDLARLLPEWLGRRVPTPA